MKKMFLATMFLLIFVGVVSLLGCTTTTDTSVTTTTAAATTTSTSSATTTSTAATTTTTTTSTTTTTAAPEASQVNSVKIAALTANGGSSVGGAASGISSATGTNPLANSSSIFAAAAPSGPPPSFNDNILTGTASTDGFLSALTSGESVGFITPKIRLITRNGKIIAGSYLSGKKIAILGTVEVSDMMSGQPGQEPAGIQAGLNSFAGLFSAEVAAGRNPYASSEIFSQISTINEYMAWSFIWPTMEVEVASQPGFPPGIQFVTPEVTTDDRIGSMETKMIFADNGGSITISVPWDTEGGPVDGSASGNGTISLLGITMEASLSMSFVNKDPSGLTITGTIPANGYIVTISMSDPTTGSGTGSLVSGETTLATIETSNTGWTAYFANGYTTSESF